MSKKQKLELTWIGKDGSPKLEPRILIEDLELSYYAKRRHSSDDIFDNKLIFGDNLLALKALEQDYQNTIKCIFIDPPYNTGSAFEHYDDGIEHSLWLTLIRDRLEILHRLLAEDGVIWIAIDDNEAHYLKVLCDEIFGRKNFITDICWKSRDSISNDLIISMNHNHILLYAKDERKVFSNRKTFRLEKDHKGFANPDNDPRGAYKFTPVDGPGGARKGNPFYTFLGVEGYWRYSLETMTKLHEQGLIIKRGKSLARKYFLSDAEASGGATATSWWDDCGTATHAKKEIIALFGQNNIFDTPKPEKLIEKVLTLSTKKGDIVLDSFAGSGTTGAVAQKMGRRWIMIELGEHCHTHIIPRLKKVIDGEDQGAITESIEWMGGGGFRYYKLAPSLLEKDKWGQWVINKTYNSNMLAAAICRHEGFTYSPSETEWWNHGFSTESDFIYVTTQILTEEQLLALSEDVGTNRTLLICCAAYRVGEKLLNNSLTNLTLKKIPNAVISKCEWGRDDYSLNIDNLPQAEIKSEPQLTGKENVRKEADLFDIPAADKE